MGEVKNLAPRKKFGTCLVHEKQKNENSVGWLVGVFFGISTLLGYLMPNPYYIYMYIICKRITRR